MTKSKNFGRKKFFGRNRFRMFQNVFQTGNLEIENFYPCNFYPGTLSFSAKMAKLVKKWLSQKILFEKFFWSESIQNALKRSLKQKSQNGKFFPSKIFLLGLIRFLGKKPKIVKKWHSRKILVENSLGRNRFRMFQNVF